MLVPRRHGSLESYKYGFQGQEKDDEIKGEGNSLNYTFRMHDPRAGRFFAVDPLFKKYPWYSPYQFSGNNLIMSNELEGAEPKTMIKENGKLTRPVVKLISSAFGFDETRINNTTWVSSQSPNITSAQKLWFFNVTGEPNATVFYKTVIYDERLRDDRDNDWLGLISHEQSHQNDMNYVGDNTFYARYISWGSRVEYRKIPTEQTAFEIEEKYVPLLLAYKEGSVLKILNSDKTEDEKSKQLNVIGLEFRIDVILKERVDKLNDKIKSVDKSIENYNKNNVNGQDKYANAMVKILEKSKAIYEQQLRTTNKQISEKRSTLEKLKEDESK